MESTSPSIVYHVGFHTTFVAKEQQFIGSRGRFLFILWRMGKSKALSSPHFYVFHTRRVSIQLNCIFAIQR